MNDIIRTPRSTSALATSSSFELPLIFTRSADDRAAFRFLEFFAASIRNPNTRQAYYRALTQFFDWLETHSPGIELHQITSISIAHYIEFRRGSAQTKNQHLSAIKRLFRWLIAGGILREDPSKEVTGIKHRLKKGKTPVLTDDEMKALFQSIELEHIVDLRDRALIGVMFYSFARIGAVLKMDVKDFAVRERRYWFILHEKGGKYHEVPAHHSAQEYVHAYIDAAGIGGEKDTPLFRTSPGRRELSDRRMSRQAAWMMIKRRAVMAGLNAEACCHSLRASGITNYLRHGGSRDNAQKIAAHEDGRTTALYDRRDDELSLDEIERIRL